MNNVQIKVIEKGDVQAWIKLSHEYDCYIEELGSLSEWYNGNENDTAFDEYINRKIEKEEAFMAFDSIRNTCLGVVAISRANNRITFFGVSSDADCILVSKLLIGHALKQLNCSKSISVNIIQHKAEIFETERAAFSIFGFAFERVSTENGIPVELYRRNAD